MKKIYIDSDVLLDLLLKRDSFYSDSRHLFDLIYKKKVRAITSTLIIANIHYILQKKLTFKKANDVVLKIIEVVKAVPFYEYDIKGSISSGFKDFEDGIQYQIFLREDLDFLITRNIRDYKSGKETILTPKEFLARFF